MKRLLRILLIIIAAFYLASCNADPKGLVSSSDVDKRFEDSLSLADKDDVEISIDEDFSFIVIADTHVYHGDASKLAALKERIDQDIAGGSKDEFVVVCGDISQCGAAEDFRAFRDVFAKDPVLPVYTAIGNHDLYFDGWSNYKEILGKSCYIFKAGPVRFVCFDSANGTLGRKQKNWLEGVLKSKTEELCVVFTHFELFSPDATTIQQYTDIEEAYYLVDLFRKTGVDYVLMGHSHEYYDKEVGGTRYVNIPDFVGSQNYFRFFVENGTIGYERKSL